MYVIIAELDQDIDDGIAVEYLFRENLLNGVVLDPTPVTNEGKIRLNKLKELGVKVYDTIPTGTKVVFNGGAFTKLAQYVEYNKLETLIIQGGFVGNNVIKNPLEKFKEKMYCRTFNFNMDPKSAERVLNSKNVGKKYLISKNVCHDIRNTVSGIWKDFKFLDKYKLRQDKRLHDLLMVVDGLNILNNRPTILEYKELNPVHRGLKGRHTEWGSIEGNKAICSVGWKEIDIKK